MAITISTETSEEQDIIEAHWCLPKVRNHNCIEKTKEHQKGVTAQVQVPCPTLSCSRDMWIMMFTFLVVSEC